MENNIEELRTLICKSLGLPEGSKRNARKRKAMDDPQVRRTPSPDDSIEVTKVVRGSYFFA
ncbi:BnaC05g21840D [Brassica napus]|uniref:BnaC05g21840D protein n=1 Tax=Brassica napus TaxID=3708 RepID=A0A078H1W4_BRANA|nr:BnaC05g21840D [Brassica napus]